jgi:hypothetical protein
MFGWLRRWRRRAMERMIEQQLAESRAIKAQWREEHGDEPFPLTPGQRRALQEKRDQLSPEMRKMLDPDDFFGLDESAAEDREEG